MTTLTTIPLITKLSGKVIRILGCNPGPMTLQGTNTYLVGTGSRRILIDSGDAETSNKYIKLLEKVLKKEHATIEHLVLTHWHHDHVGGVKFVQKLLSTLNFKGEPAKVWKLPRAPTDDNTPENFNWECLKDEQIFDLGNTKLIVKHTPGHTTDHACLLLEDEKSLFSGDCILGESTTVFENLHDYMISLKKILNLGPTVIYPGHGPILMEPKKYIEYYIKHREERELQILKVLSEFKDKHPVSEMVIVQHIYKDTPEHLWNAAASNVRHHLEKLLKENKVNGSNGNWYLVEGLENKYV